MINYQVNSNQIAHESIEDEIVIIHLDNGNYFNLQGTGGSIWNGIVEGKSTKDIISYLVNNYEVQESAIIESVKNFIDQLMSEELIIESNETTRDDGPHLSLTPTDRKALFTPPVLEKYEDMQDLLLLDPLHDVNESVGWPARKTAD
ncbi:MAG: hypothetical protein N5P05_003793 [Chroococcopsis gigantea SAG 12.99]|jgi:hypothetical protein|nr:PqqD family protein [Chlorogloea purpurea SAG 13.99]MDV3002187.1 hypothetical protein [Chroococcopsis gigantea SAG 12.99]